MKKAIIIDLDGTLAPIGLGMKCEDMVLLREIESRGYRIIICSGKQLGYLTGFARQINLKAPVLAGENGSAYQFGVDLPPKEYGRYPFSDKAEQQLNHIRNILHKELSYDEVWYQPNEYEVTPFPKKEYVFGKIADILEREKDSTTELTIYRHVDCYDINPSCISKGNMAELLCGKLGIDRSDLIAIGDAVNDISMLDFAGVSISVNPDFNYDADYTFDCLNDAFQYILENEL